MQCSMNYRTPFTPEEHAAYVSMPKTADGHTMSLFFVPLGQRDAMEAQWREWAKGTPKHLYPNWFEDWARFKQSGAVPQYVGAIRR
jgi:hypothetical protein